MDKLDKYDNCDKNQPIVLANSSNHSRALRHTDNTDLLIAGAGSEIQDQYM